MDNAVIFDAATMSRTPEGTAIVAAVLAVVAAALWGWAHAHGQGMGVLTGWFLAAAALMGAVSAASFVERRMIGASTDYLEVQGPVLAIWENRTLRTVGKNDYWNWQGFQVGGVEFAYRLNLESNYFNNTGPHRVDLREGLPLRIRYVEERDGETVRRHIVRVSWAEGAAVLPAGLAASTR